ncbi:MAG: cytochrome c biogenesis protein CcsA [Thermoanaerobaculia bacterium]
MFWPGVAVLWGALLSGLASLYGYFRADRSSLRAVPGVADAWLGFARRAYTAFAACIVGTSAILMSLILNHRFDVSYVASYSARDLPLHFLISCFWAGQEGSFLLWIFWGSLIGLFVWRTAKEMEAPVMIVYLSTFLALVAILCRQSPFRLLATVPPDGTGLNPLLQDYWMVIHPPVMFLGFASLSVPFSFAIAALWKKRWDGWIVRAIPWALLTFLTLGTAILMGGYWAYKTLGWGGYWGWDPVENTSLVPWLLTVALVHGMFLQRSRNKHRKVNLFLAILAYICILYGTFLTRSGVLADFSVHSFVDLGITGWLIADLGGFLLLGVALLAWRWKSIPSEQEESPVLSRSVLFIVGVAALVGLGLVILLGTSSPLLTRLAGKPSQVSNDFYRLTTTPGGFLLALLFALVPVVSWKGETPASIWKNSRRSLAIAFAAVVFAAVVGARRPEALLFVAVSAFGFDMNLRAVVRKARGGKFGGAGGYLAHVGVSIMLAGIVLSALYAVSRRVTLPKNTPVSVAGYTMTFTNVIPATETSKQAMEVLVRSPRGKVFYAYPKMYINTRTNQLMANPSIRSNPLMDLYVSPQEYDPGAPKKMGKDVTLHKGQSVTLGGVALRFDEFEVDRSQMTAGARELTIRARMTVTAPGKAPAPATLEYVAHLDGSTPNQGRPATVPGTAAGVMTVQGVSAAEESVILNVSGLGSDFIPAVPETLSVDVTRKPLISLVWGGFYVMMFGGLLAFLKRSKQARAAVLAEERAASADAPAPPRPPMRPSPAHARAET